MNIHERRGSNDTGQQRCIEVRHGSSTDWQVGVTVCMLWAVFTLLFVLGPTEPAFSAECDLSPSGQCTKTSAAALRSCDRQAKGDFWLEVGNCRNLTSGRNRCIVDAKDDRADDRDECREVCDARQGVCEGVGQDAYAPFIDPEDFVSPSEAAASPNKFFPLVPGTSWEYEGEDETIIVEVTDRTLEILGVTCVVVRDVAAEDDEVVEDTDDWYAQDKAGNVWYFGEISQEFEDGILIGVDGSWKSGEGGAKPGIVMFAEPEVGDFYRQEFFLGEAEDIAEVLSLTADEEIDLLSCDSTCLQTAETTPLEPDVLEHKFYAEGVGLIVEIDIETGDRVELVEFTQP